MTSICAYQIITVAEGFLSIAEIIPYALFKLQIYVFQCISFSFFIEMSIWEYMLHLDWDSLSLCCLLRLLLPLVASLPQNLSMRG